MSINGKASNEEELMRMREEIKREENKEMKGEMKGEKKGEEIEMNREEMVMIEAVSVD